MNDMKLIKRLLQAQLFPKIQAGKVVVILGPRRVGKTVLLKTLLQDIDEPFLLWNGEDTELEKRLRARSIVHYKNIIGDYKLLIIDEAQKIKEIGLILKLMVDHLDGLKIIATGSSAFDLNLRLGEPLTGRKWTFRLFPISAQEWAMEEDFMTQEAQLNERLVLGNYPELMHLANRQEKEQYLTTLVKDYLLKDIFELEGLRNTRKLTDLLRLLAHQAGSEVSLTELGRQLGMDRKTVDRYIDLLEQVFIVFNVRGYSRNLRKEIVKNSKWYFFDNGIRNALISNFKPVELRNDQGLLWENYIIGERLKWQHYNGMASNNFFWRTYDQQEIDWVEERGGGLHAYEMKWGKKKARVPRAWKKAYPNATFQVVSPENYRDFVIKNTGRV